MILRVFLLFSMYELAINWKCIMGMDIFVNLQWICSEESATFIFSLTTVNINSIDAVTAEISLETSIINSPEEVNKSIEQSNVSFEKLLWYPN